MQDRTRDVRIDVLRVAAIVFILLHHSDDYGTQFLLATPTLAVADAILTWVALAVLFSISGFLTLRSGAATTARGWRHVRRRFARLYLPFAMALLLFNPAGVTDLAWSAVLINLVLLGPWIGPDVRTLWFVEVLLYYHAVLALWLSSGRLRTRPWTIPVLVGLVTVGAGVLASSAGFTLDNRSALFVPAFAGGACFGAALAFRDGGGRPWIGAMILEAVTSVAVGVAVASVPIWPDLPPLGLVVSIVTTLLVGTLLSFPQRPESADRPSHRLIRILAYGSFMAYLAHRFVFQFVANAAAPLGPDGVPIAVAMSVPLVLVVGILLQRGYDMLAARVTGRAVRRG